MAQSDIDAPARRMCGLPHIGERHETAAKESSRTQYMQHFDKFTKSCIELLHRCVLLYVVKSATLKNWRVSNA